MQPRILPESEPGIAAYMAVATQWRVGFTDRSGLDYTAVIATLKLHLPKWRRQSTAWKGLTLADILGDVQIVENAMLAADSERREQDEMQRAVQQ